MAAQVFIIDQYRVAPLRSMKEIQENSFQERIVRLSERNQSIEELLQERGFFEVEKTKAS